MYNNVLGLQQGLSTKLGWLIHKCNLPCRAIEWHFMVCDLMIVIRRTWAAIAGYGINNAFSASPVTCRLFKAITCSKSAASHGNVRGPSPDKPDSSSANLSSFLRILLCSYSSGGKSRFWSAEYTTKWPFSAGATAACICSPKGLWQSACFSPSSN
jgi:hypothetical protein